MITDPNKWLIIKAMKDLKITKGEWRVRVSSDGDDFFIEAPNLNMPQLGYGIEIMGDDFGDHNGYPFEQRMADAKLIADAGNTAQLCGLLPSELLKQRDELLEAAKGIAELLPLTPTREEWTNACVKLESAITKIEAK
jgi:hypothetical protein